MSDKGLLAVIAVILLGIIGFFVIEAMTETSSSEYTAATASSDEITASL